MNLDILISGKQMAERVNTHKASLTSRFPNTIKTEWVEFVLKGYWDRREMICFAYTAGL